MSQGIARSLPRRVSAQLQTVPPAYAGAILLVLLLSPLARATLEHSMVAHMMLQFPLAALAGAWLAASLPQRVARWLATFNRAGLAGLLCAALALALLMIPRVLDLAVADLQFDAAKLLLLALTGGALRLSWPLAGPVLKGFFLGNVLPMMTVVGWLYLQAPQRLCNVYLLDDQWRVGQLLIWGSIGLAAAWLLYVGLGLQRTRMS